MAEVILDGLGRLTTEHAASSDGQPVLLLGGSMEATWPGDLIEVGGELQPAALVVGRWLDAAGENVTDAERDLAEAFVGAFVVQ